MAVLVIAEHDNAKLAPSTRSTVTAAVQLASGPVHVLVAGLAAAPAAEEASRLAGIEKVLLGDAEAYRHGLAEPLAALIVALAADYDAVLAPASTFGKNLLPRAAALLDVAQISDIVAVAAPDTFVRPIYAGNALATVQSKDKLKLITVRSTAFAPAGEGAAAPVIPVAMVAVPELSGFVERTLVKLDRPELTAARVVVSGGRNKLI